MCADVFCRACHVCMGHCLLRGDAAKIQLHRILVLQGVHAAAFLCCRKGSILGGVTLHHQKWVLAACTVVLDLRHVCNITPCCSYVLMHG